MEPPTDGTKRMIMHKIKMRGILATVAVAASLLVAAPADAGNAGQIPDEGLPAAPIASSALVSERTEILQAGVVGRNDKNDSFPNTNIRVTSFAEIGNTIYVGGKFTQVEIAATGALHDQRFLAAFNRDTGAWIDTFRPTIDGNVWDLKATDDGRLIVAGQFTKVNGQPHTTSVAMLDATTGAVDADWRVSLDLTGSSDRPLARTLEIEGNQIYIGGNFTRIRGSDGKTSNAGRIARVNLSTGNVEGAFLPNIDGVVFDIDATADRVYAVGNFSYVNGIWSIGVARMQPGNGELVPGLQDPIRTYIANTRNSYQQAVLALGNDVWQVGAQHSRQVYNQSDYSLIRSWVSDPWGDGQALVHLNGIVYSGSHANGDTLLHRDAYRWPGNTGSTATLPIRWMAAFDATAHEQIAWYPQVGTSAGEGSWELFADSTECLWSGGDFNRGSFDGNTARYAQGFAKFCTNDSIAPAPPTNPTAEVTSNGVNLAWTASTGDDRGGPVRYELLKNDTVFASYINITTFRDPTGTPADRYFVRTMDYTGNRSATTRVFTATDIDTTRPTTPTDLQANIEVNSDITLTWTPATDNVAVDRYKVFRNGEAIATVSDPAHTIEAPGPGDHWYQVRAIDTSDNHGFKTEPVKVTIEANDTTPPRSPRDLNGNIEANGDVTLTWTPSTDNIAVTAYKVFRNSTEIATVTDPTHTVTAPAVGDHYYQVRAIDAANNESFKTPSTKITIAPDPGNDTTPPRTPTNLEGAIEGNGDVTLTWTPSTDNIAVTAYKVFRNSTEIATVTDPTHTVTAPAVGDHYYQVRAIDAANNESPKTPPTKVTI